MTDILDTIDREALRIRAEELRENFRRAFEAARPGLIHLGRQVAGIAEGAARVFHAYNPAAWHKATGVKRRRCPHCIPAFARPKPLCIDGHAYRRRQRARVRRKR